MSVHHLCPQVYLKELERQHLQDTLHKDVMRKIIFLQRWFRARLQRTEYLAMRRAAIVLQVRAADPAHADLSLRRVRTGLHQERGSRTWHTCLMSVSKNMLRHYRTHNERQVKPQSSFELLMITCLVCALVCALNTPYSILIVYHYLVNMLFRLAYRDLFDNTPC